MADIHKTEEYLSNTVENLEKENCFSERELQLFQEWKEHMEAEGIGNKRIKRYISGFNTIGKYIEFDLLDPNKKELKRFIGKLNNNQLNGKEYSVWTLREFKKTLRKFYQFHLEEEDPEILDFMTLTINESDKPKASFDELPQPKDIKSMVKQAESSRDKALVFLVWDTGGRIGEILNLKWKDVNFNEKGAKIKIRHSKSMKRSVPIYESVHHLREWKQSTEKDSPEDHVFINNSKRGNNEKYFGNQLGYNSARKVFKNLCSNVERDFKDNPHAFRKGRATYLASQGWNSAQLCEFFGWNDFSTAKTYIRMAKKDLDSAMKQTMGIEKNEDEETEDLRPAKCGNCGSVNPATRDYCSECEHLISKEKELLRESVANEVKHEVKNDVIKTMLQEHGITEETVEENIREETRERLEEKGFL
jgi:site-specific recombinase XerD